MKLSKESHLEYVNAHTERLQARLAEDEAQRLQLLQDIEKLEQDIQALEEDIDEN